MSELSPIIYKLTSLKRAPPMSKSDKNERKMNYCRFCSIYNYLILFNTKFHSNLTSTQSRLCNVLYKPQPKKVEALK